jgi:tRNA pseudouridine38-40 synthase
MARYFIEVAYKGTNYAGFQIQQNANTIQAEIEKALHIYYRVPFELTGSSRTDAGVHAQQNFFHFNTSLSIDAFAAEKAIYHLNAILPLDIVVKNITQVAENGHCRFDAISRSYVYSINKTKNPFVLDSAYYFPYTLDIVALNAAAALLLTHSNFQSFSKKNTQVFTYECMLSRSIWIEENDLLQYHVTGNRFLRGMVRGLVGTMLLVGRGKYSLEKFKAVIENRNNADVDFSAPAKGLILKEVKFNSI